MSELAESRAGSPDGVPISPRAKGLWCWGFAMMFQAGIPVLETLRLIDVATEDEVPKDFTRFLDKIIREGMLFEDLKGNLPSEFEGLNDGRFIEKLIEGEANGTLDEEMFSLAEVYFDEDRLSNPPQWTGLARFSRSLQESIESEDPILQGLERSKAALNPTVDQIDVERIDVLINHINEGDTLSESFARCPDTFPKAYVGIVNIGENCGCLEKVFERLARL